MANRFFAGFAASQEDSSMVIGKESEDSPRQVVIRSVELCSLDTRYEGYRIKNKAAERALLASISENGIREALQGAEVEGNRILLDGFKRYRCAKKLGIGIVPFFSLGADAAAAIIQVLRIGQSQNLNILEQARFVEDLRTAHKMCVSDIANLLERSKSWVSMRAGLLDEVSETVLEKIFAGEFPVYAYMYILRRFIRMNTASKEEIDEFVLRVGGNDLSFREIAMLADGYFRGNVELSEQIRSGDIQWALKRMKESAPQPKDCSQLERSLLRDLEIVGRLMQRIRFKSGNARLKSGSFFAQAGLLIKMILGQNDPFLESIRCLHDQSGKT
jgi:hypothetical protein